MKLFPLTKRNQTEWTRFCSPRLRESWTLSLSVKSTVTALAHIKINTYRTVVPSLPSHQSYQSFYMKKCLTSTWRCTEISEIS